MNTINLDLANPLIVTWLELAAIFAPLHMNEPAEVSRLHDIWAQSMPAPTWTVAIPGKAFDERAPKVGDNFKTVVNPLALIAWIREVSAKRGFPYSERQAANLLYGVEDYG